MSPLINTLNEIKNIDKLLSKEEERNFALKKRFEEKLTELKRLSLLLNSEIKKDSYTEDEKNWLMLYKNNFIEEILNILIKQEKI